MSTEARQIKYPISFTGHARKRLKERQIHGSTIKEFISYQKTSFEPVKVKMPGSHVAVIYRDQILPGRCIQRIIISVMLYGEEAESNDHNGTRR